MRNVRSSSFGKGFGQSSIGVPGGSNKGAALPQARWAVTWTLGCISLYNGGADEACFDLDAFQTNACQATNQGIAQVPLTAAMSVNGNQYTTDPPVCITITPP